jgi:hypothetical protein
VKFTIRRAVVGAVGIPVVAGAYVALNAVLIGLGATPTASVVEVWNTGLVFGVAAAIAFTFSVQWKLVK